MPIRRVLQAGAVILLAALIGLFAKSVIDNQTSIAATSPTAAIRWRRTSRSRT